MLDLQGIDSCELNCNPSDFEPVSWTLLEHRLAKNRTKSANQLSLELSLEFDS